MKKSIVHVVLIIDTEDVDYAYSIANNELQCAVDGAGNDLFKDFVVGKIEIGEGVEK